jgi:hypothetical protein
MRVDTIGNIGIGTQTPSTRVDVSGTAAFGIRYLRTDARDARLTVGDPTRTWSLSTGWAVGGDLSIIEEGVAGDRFYIQKGTGNVGISTTSPAFKLDVNGTAQMTGFKLSTEAGANRVLTSDASGVGTWGQITGAGIADGTITADKLAAGVVSAWNLTGNTGTNPDTNFLGTTDNQPLVLKANNQRVLQMQYVLTANGNDLGMNVLGVLAQ